MQDTRWRGDNGLLDLRYAYEADRRIFRRILDLPAGSDLPETCTVRLVEEWVVAYLRFRWDKKRPALFDKPISSKRLGTFLYRYDIDDPEVLLRRSKLIDMLLELPASERQILCERLTEEIAKRELEQELARSAWA